MNTSRMTSAAIVLLGLLCAGVSLPEQASAHNVQARPATATPPPGIQPLPVDMWTTRNFYLDMKYWTDPRYARCNTPRQLTDMWSRQNRPGQWGDCKLDYDKAKIVSPYRYRTAEEHYNALLAETKAAGGPTVHTR